MKAVKDIENKLGDLYKGAPAMPDSSKESLANAWPWIALVFGVLQLLAAWFVWGVIASVEKLYTATNIYTAYTGVNYGLSSMDKLFIYLGAVMLVVDGVILLMAYGPLKNRARRGWDLIFLAALLNLAYAVVSLFIQDRGVGSFIGSLIGSAIGFYLLFQVRDKFAK